MHTQRAFRSMNLLVFWRGALELGLILLTSGCVYPGGKSTSNLSLPPRLCFSEFGCLGVWVEPGSGRSFWASLVLFPQLFRSPFFRILFFLMVGW